MRAVSVLLLLCCPTLALAQDLDQELPEATEAVPREKSVLVKGPEQPATITFTLVFRNQETADQVLTAFAAAHRYAPEVPNDNLNLVQQGDDEERNPDFSPQLWIPNPQTPHAFATLKIREFVLATVESLRRQQQQQRQ